MNLDDVEIVELDLHNISEILDIERMSFTTPWSRDAFISELSIPHSFSVGIKSRKYNSILAFAVFWLIDDEVHILNIAVNPQFRKKGLARYLLSSIITQAKSVLCKFVFLEVRPSNKSALALYESMNFVFVGKRPGYYSDTGEDALLYTLYLEDNFNESQ
ncbi:MAG: ribosomal protein S18-alanine N-acetyltransferase [Deltaproteobacteria bacterium]|nr:ribosomal protein S18-alanine N-acetyltransferase [Deltaproteobacteria bacterium]